MYRELGMAYWLNEAETAQTRCARRMTVTAAQTVC